MPSVWEKIAVLCVFFLAPFALAARTAPSAARPPAASQEAAPASTIVIHARKYEFSPSEITLKEGQTVKLQLTSDDVKHSLLVPGLGIDAVMKKGRVTDVVVTPDKAGDFKGKCGVFCGSGHRDMHFLVHVLP